jgi:hypothetical protein
MQQTIHGIPIVADSALSTEEIDTLVFELVQEWAWEGRQLGKIELISNGNLVHICSYEKPSTRIVWLQNHK